MRFYSIYLALAVCCLVDCETEEILPFTVENTHRWNKNRVKRGIFTVAKEFFRVKQITDTVLSNAREIKQATGTHLKNTGVSFTKYEKFGGHKQAYRDFNLFRAEQKQDFLLPGGGEGKWAMVGDRVILLERRKDRNLTTLMIKRGPGTSNEHIDKIIYKDSKIL